MLGDYDLGEEGLLVYCPNPRDEGEGRGLTVRLVIPESLQIDFLHHYHTSLKGGHQEIRRTYQRIWRYCHWKGLFRSVQRCVGSCMDCETWKGGPTQQEKSLGNIEATYPFHIIAMDHIPSVALRKYRTAVTGWLFIGYVMAKAGASWTAHGWKGIWRVCFPPFWC